MDIGLGEEPGHSEDKADEEYYFEVIHPYSKVTGYLTVCLCLPKNLANRLTDMVLLFSGASQRSWKGLNKFINNITKIKITNPI